MSYLPYAVYERYLDRLQAYLIANLNFDGIDNGPITWIIGDPGGGIPDRLPVGFIVPLWKSVEAYTNGLDKVTLVSPLLVIDDLNQYGPPINNANAAGGLEQPGFRSLIQYGEAINGLLRNGGAGITLEGDIATSVTPAMNAVFLRVDNKVYRGIRLAVSAQLRASWAGN